MKRRRATAARVGAHRATRSGLAKPARRDFMARLLELFSGFRRKPSSGAVRETQARPAIAWVIAGLGNPDEQYRRSRHNLGFAVMDRMAAARSAEFTQRKFKALVANAPADDGRSLLLVKPQTYYYLSGECLKSILSYFKVPAKGLIVVHDELDIEAGCI